MALNPNRVRGSGATAVPAPRKRFFLLPAILIFSVAVPCQAQDANSEIATEDVDELIDEILVTGTRITRKNLISTSPLTQVNADEFLYKGITRVEDLLNDLPQVFPGHHANLSYEATGTATVDLRGLG